jgi:hypothetical protein
MKKRDESVRSSSITPKKKDSQKHFPCDNGWKLTKDKRIFKKCPSL